MEKTNCHGASEVISAGLAWDRTCLMKWLHEMGHVLGRNISAPPSGGRSVRAKVEYNILCTGDWATQTWCRWRSGALASLGSLQALITG